MDTSIESTISQEPHMILELVSEDIYTLDLGVLNALAGDLTADLQHEGYLVRLPDTARKTRGGEFLIEIIQATGTLATNVWTHKDLVERALTDTGALVTVCQGVVPVLRFINRSHKKRATPESGPLKITLEIDDHPITVEAANLEQADAALALAQQYATAHPYAKKRVTPQSKTKIKGTLPKQQQRRGKSAHKHEK